MVDAPLLAIEARLLLKLAPKLAQFPYLRAWEQPSAEACRDVRVLAAVGSTPIAAADMDRFPALAHIACFAVGIDGVDMAAAAARGISVTGARSANAPDVAEHALGLLLALLCRIDRGKAQIASGKWQLKGPLPPRRALRSMRIGIVGMGAIGKAVAERLAPFGCDIAWWGPRQTDSFYPLAESLVALARDCDALVVTARADDENRKMIDADVIAALGSDGYLVNIARGSLIDEDALIAALHEGRLAGAALDVFAVEPAGPEWSKIPRLIATPHVGGATFESLALLADGLVTRIDALLDAPSPPLP